MDVRDLIVEIAAVGLDNFAVRKALATLSQFVEKGTGTPFTLLIEGEFGVGKTTFAAYIPLAVISVLTLHLFSKLDITGRGLKIALPPREKIGKFSQDLFNVCKCFWEGDVETVRSYLRQCIAFSLDEIIERVKLYSKAKKFLPFLLIDDAGIIFLRTLWTVSKKVERIAVIKLIKLFQVMRTFTSMLIATAPSRKVIMTRVEEVFHYLARVQKKSQEAALQLGNKIYRTDRYVTYFQRMQVTIAGRAAETYVLISTSYGVSEPLFIVGYEILKPVLEEVWKVREEFIRRIEEELESLVAKGEKRRV